jgi:hypothetical protein
MAPRGVARGCPGSFVEPPERSPAACAKAATIGAHYHAALASAATLANWVAAAVHEFDFIIAG